MVPLYSDGDERRYIGEDPPKSLARTQYRRDFGRVIHCPSFRRLQGKTQLFPGYESDFFRNRLTHSLEVAQIAESIALHLNEKDPYLKENPIDPRLCFTAGLLHDIGHPPFGHNGEHALDHEMREFGGFEGNAQTLRIITQLEKKVVKIDDLDPISRRCGLNLTYRQLASILKYDRIIDEADPDRRKPKKGYYFEDREVVADIKANVAPNLPDGRDFKTIECWIMDLADDIAYSTYDLEDCLKAGFLTPSKILGADEDLFKNVARSVSKDTEQPFTAADALGIFVDMFMARIEESRLSKDDFSETDANGRLLMSVKALTELDQLNEDSRLRTEFTSDLVGSFIEDVDFQLDPDFPMLSSVTVSLLTKQKIETLKTFTYEAMITSSRLKLAEYRGGQIISEIFQSLANNDGYRIMPSDQIVLHKAADTLQKKNRVICDFIAGMTDRYALEFHGRLFSDSPVSMFKDA